MCLVKQEAHGLIRGRMSHSGHNHQAPGSYYRRMRRYNMKQKMRAQTKIKKEKTLGVPREIEDRLKELEEFWNQ